MVHQHYGCADRQEENGPLWMGAGHILCISPSSHAPVPIALATREAFKVFIESAPRKQTTLAAIKDTLQRQRGSLRSQAVESQAHLLSEHSLLHLCGGRLRPQPHGKNHLPERRTGNGQLVLATDGEGRARARNVGEGHLIAHFGGIERAEKSVNV